MNKAKIAAYSMAAMSMVAAHIPCSKTSAEYIDVNSDGLTDIVITTPAAIEYLIQTENGYDPCRYQGQDGYPYFASKKTPGRIYGYDGSIFQYDDKKVWPTTIRGPTNSDGNAQGIYHLPGSVGNK